MLKIAKRKPSKSEVSAENYDFNSRVILVGISKGPQDAASLKGKMLPVISLCQQQDSSAFGQ